ncbi:MAG: ATP-binding protein [Pseudomonadota bacterium]
MGRREMNEAEKGRLDRRDSPRGTGTAGLRRAFLASALAMLSVSAVLFYVSYVFAKTEHSVRREIVAVYYLQLEARGLFNLGHVLLSARNTYQRDSALASIEGGIRLIEDGIGREPLALDPIVRLVNPDLDRQSVLAAYARLDRRLALLVETAKGMTAANSDLEIEIKVASLRALTRNELMVDLQAITSWYDRLADRVGNGIAIVDLVGLPLLLGAFGTIWFFSVGPALRRAERMTQHLRAREGEARQLAAAADAASAAKSHFVANMSHEIRTPMNGIIAVAELLQSCDDPAERQRLLQTIDESGQLLMSIVNDVLDFSKIEAGEVSLEQIPFRPADLCRQVAALWAPRAAAKGIGLELEICEEANAPRLGDPHRITQILGNIVSNALKFTETGTVSIAVTAPRGESVVLCVQDSGIGMTQHQATRVFDEFAQADSSTNRRYGGTGLGLSIVKRLVNAMDGEISLVSERDAGTAVTISLPLPQLVDAAAPSSQAEAADRLPEGLRVLAADDNATNRMVLDKLLATFGCTTRLVKNGQEAVDAVAAERFDVVLLDISMPVMDGLQAVTAMRARERELGIPRVPAIAATANAFDHQIRSYREAGFDEHVAKPLRRVTLSAALTQVLELRADQALTASENLVAAATDAPMMVRDGRT